MSALCYFPGDPRGVQTAALQEVTAHWNDADVHVIVSPTGSGKSNMAVALARWAVDFDRHAAIVVTDGMLQRQYETAFPDLPSLWGGDDYRCATYPDKPCAKASKLKRKACTAVCPQLAAVLRCQSLRLVHRATYRGNHGKTKRFRFPHLAIFDEAHQLREFLQADAGVKLWHHQFHYPAGLDDQEAVLKWLQSRTTSNPRLLKARKLIENQAENVVVQRRWLEYYGQMKEALCVEPLSPRNVPPFLWPRNVEKVVLLSATIWPKDVEDLGLDRGRRVRFTYCDSPIPAASRPVDFHPVAPLTLRKRHAHMPDIVAAVERIATHHAGEPGLVHLTYDEVPEFQRFLTSARYLWHTRDSKQHTLQQYLEQAAAGGGQVLMASGMREGVDLKGHLARFQVVTKVPYPNLGVQAVARRQELDPEWYDLEAVKAIIQMSGRVCRDPTDYGVTYVLDPRFKELFERREYLFPAWFARSIRW